MADEKNSRKLSAAEAEQIIARAASLDADGEGGSLSADDVRASALAAGIAPHAVERALREARSPVVAPSSGTTRYMGLPAVIRASATVASAITTPEEIAKRMQIALGADASVKNELGLLRAKTGNQDTVILVVPGTPTTISVVSDHADGVAISALAYGIVGLFVGGITSATFLGFQGQAMPMLVGLVVGTAFGLGWWRLYWSRLLAHKANEVNTIAASVAAALSEP